MKKILACVLAALSLYSVEHHLDVTPSIGLKDVSTITSLEADYRIIIPFEEHSIIINPKLKGCASGRFGTAFGIGLRRDLDSWTAGTFLFVHYSHLKRFRALQAGPSIELVGKHVDVRLNGYFPACQSNKVYNPAFIDTEVAYKHRQWHFGGGPCYDLSERRVGFMNRVSYDLPFGGISLHGGLDPLKGLSLKLSITIFKFSSSSEHGYALKHHEYIHHRHEVARKNHFNKSVERGIPLPYVGDLTEYRRHRFFFSE